MRIKFIQTFATDRDCYVGTTIHDLTQDHAMELVRLGIAIPDPTPVAITVEPIKQRRKGG